MAVIGCGAKKNRLAEASSPYLQQHADNPVDWFEWGDEALQKAKSENKPLLVSIGYASCHWCHKMEEECFMDVEVAEMMNENFVCIKVDREERPDIDEIYMNACQMISGTAGWPLNAFALPDGKPFFAGTYYSRQSWLNLLEKIASAYRTQHSKVVLQANALTNGIVKLEIPLDTFSEQPKISEMLYKNFFDSLFHRIDLTNGGFTGTPKFPLPGAVEFLLQYGFITKNQNAVHAAEQWLTKMALGGIYDQVGGGFARYAVDKYWRTPHFEKMLYDNGQLLSAYSHAFQLSGNPFFKEIAEETAAFALNNLRAENGAFYSSLNAVTPDGEGVYYAWSHKEFQKVAGSSAASLSRYYHVTPEGNWKNGLNILYATTTPTEFSQQLGRDSVKFWDVLRSSKARLLSHRDQRKKPEVDTKIITSWNALMITGLLDAFAALQQQEYLDGALAAARFIEKKMLGQDGLLMRTYNEGKDTIPGFLEDYAQLAKAYIRLYQITFDKHWLLLANKLAKTTLDKFFDRRTGMFYTTPQDAKLVVVRKMSLVDDAMPSDNATMAHVLHHLGLYFDNEEYLEKSAQMMSTVTAQMSADPRHYPQWGLVAGLYVYGAFEIAICGREAISRNHQMQKHYLPLNLYLGSTDQENLFLLQGKLVPDQTLIYACVNRVCKRPVETVQEALQQLEDARASRISAVTRTTK